MVGMADDELRAERAILRTLAALCGLVLVLFVLGAVFHEEVVAGSTAFVDTLGPWGVALGFFIPDATALPLPHDVFLAAGRVGGLSFGTLVVWASTGSILGGLCAYGAARTLAGTAWFEARKGKKVEQARKLAERQILAFARPAERSQQIRDLGAGPFAAGPAWR